VKAGRRALQIGWRVAVAALLLVWIFHSIFVNEARLAARQGRLVARNGTPVEWDTLKRPEQWRYGWQYGPPALWSTLRRIDVRPLALSFVLMGVTLVLGVMRWRMVLRVQGLELSFGRAMEISLVAQFFNSFLLGTAGGDLMKAYYAARETHHKKTEAVVTVFVDRVFGLWSMLLFAGVMIVPNARLLEQPGLRTATGLLGIMLVAASGFMLVAFRGGVSKAWPAARLWLRRLPKGEYLERSLDSCRLFGQQQGFVLRALGLSMLVNFVMVLQFWVVSRGLGLQVPLHVLCLVVPMIVCVSALPITPSGLGVRENLFVHALAVPAIAVAATPALSLSLLAYAGSLFWSLVGGVVYLTLKDRHRLAEAELEGEEGGSREASIVKRET
jgi:glycosyltransferase 2 family protein